MSRPSEVEPDHKKDHGNENGQKSNNGRDNNGHGDNNGNERDTSKPAVADPIKLLEPFLQSQSAGKSVNGSETARTEKATDREKQAKAEKKTSDSDKDTDLRVKTPSGTLVCRDSDYLRAYSVQEGKIKDGSGKVIGSFDDKTHIAKINGKEIKIGEAKDSAFHGIGSDNNKLDLLTKESKKHLTGTLSNGDNSETITIVGGHLYDSQNKYLGILDDDGIVEQPSAENTTGYQPINSLYNRFKFKGELNGKSREFFTSSDNTSGKLFLPTENGNRRECEVKVGMIIDKATGEQIGSIVAPELSNAGKLEGGLVYLKEGNALRAQSLASLRGASFDLTPLSETGRIGDTVRGKLKGICLGDEKMADGRTRPDQGILNVNQAVISETRLKKQLNAELKAVKEGDWLISPSHISGANETKMSDLAGRVTMSSRRVDEFERALSRARLTETDISHLKQNLVDAQFQSAGSTLAFRKQKLDNTESILEKLPKSSQIDPQDPEKTRPIQGTVKFHNEKGQLVEYSIKDSVIFSPDHKQIGTIKANGLIELPDSTKENPKLVEMKSLGATKDQYLGAIWDLEYTDEAGKNQRLQWASLGDRIVSKANLSNEAYQEHFYAYEVDKLGKTENSRAIYDATGARRNQFDRKLANIFEHGIKGQEDLKLLASGGKSIRLEVVQSSVEVKSEPIDIPKLDEKTALAVNGKLRIGNDIYQIRNGDLFRYKLGKAEQNACGKLKSGYNVEINGQGEFSLASENRVLLDMTMADGNRHQLIGLGRGHMTDNFGYVSGGLVDVQELRRQCEEHYKQAIAGNKEYFDKRPYLTGGLASYLMEGRDEQLQAFAQDIKKKIDLLQKTVYENEGTTSQQGKENNSLFVRGFKSGVLDGSQVDTSIMLVQSILNATGSQAVDTNYLAEQGAQVQRQVNDGVVMAAMTVATAGIGTGFSALANAQRIANLGRMGTVMLYAGEVGTSAMAGGLISSVGRASNESKFSNNFKGGMIEGGTMALGSLGGKFIGNSATVKEARELLKAYRAGAQLAPQQLKLASTLSKSLTGRMIEAGMSDAKILAARQIGRVLETAGSATGFHLAAQAREGQELKLDGQSTLTGTAFMLAGHYIGHGIERFTKTQAIKSFVSSTTNNMTYGTLDGLPAAFQQQDMETAARLGVSVDMLGDEIKQANRDFGKAVHEAMKTGAIAALTNLPGHLALHGITSVAHTIKQHIQTVKGNQEAVKHNTASLPQAEDRAVQVSSNDSDVTNNRIFRADNGHNAPKSPHQNDVTDLVYSSDNLYSPSSAKAAENIAIASTTNSSLEQGQISLTDGRMNGAEAKPLLNEAHTIHGTGRSKDTIPGTERQILPPDPKDKPIRYMRPLSPDEDFGGLRNDADPSKPEHQEGKPSSDSTQQGKVIMSNEVVLTAEDLRMNPIDLAKKYGISADTAKKALDRGSFKRLLPRNRIELTPEQMQMSAPHLAKELGIQKSTAERALKKGFYLIQNRPNRVELTEQQKRMTALDLARELNMDRRTAENALRNGFYRRQKFSQKNRVELTEQQKRMTALDLAKELGVAKKTAENALSRGYYVQKSTSQDNRVELTEEQMQMTALNLSKELGIARRTAERALKNGFYVPRILSDSNKIMLTDEQKQMTPSQLAKYLGIRTEAAERAIKKGFYAPRNISKEDRIELNEEQRQMAPSELAKQLGINTETAERVLKKGFHIRQNVSAKDRVELTEKQMQMTALDLAKELGVGTKTAENALSRGFYVQREVSAKDRVELTEKQMQMTALDLAKELGVGTKTAENALSRGFYVQREVSAQDRVELTEAQRLMTAVDLARELGIKQNTAERVLNRGFYVRQNVSEKSRVELTERQKSMTAIDLARDLGIHIQTAQRALKKGFYVRQNTSARDKVELTEQQKRMTALDLSHELGIDKRTAENALRKGFYVQSSSSREIRVELTEAQRQMTPLDLARGLGIHVETAERALKKGFFMQRKTLDKSRVEITEAQRQMTPLDLARELGITQRTAQKALKKGFYVPRRMSAEDKVELTEEQKQMTALDLAKELGIGSRTAERALKRGFYLQQDVSEIIKVELTEKQRQMPALDLARELGISSRAAERALKKGFYVQKNVSQEDKAELTEEQKQMTPLDLAKELGMLTRTAERALKKGFYIERNKANKVELTEEQKLMTAENLAKTSGIAVNTAKRALKRGFYLRHGVSETNKVELTEDQRHMTWTDLAVELGIEKDTAERALKNGYFRKVEISETSKVRLTEEQKLMSPEELGNMLGIKEHIAARALARGYLMRRHGSQRSLIETRTSRATERLGITNDEAADLVPHVKTAAQRADIELDNYGALVCLAVMKARGVSRAGLTANKVISEHAKDAQAVRQILRLNEGINISQALNVFNLRKLLSNSVSGETNVSLDRAVSKIEFSDPASKEKVREDLAKHVESLIDKAETDKRTEDAERLYSIMLALDDKAYNESPEGQALVSIVQAQSSVCWQSALRGNDLGSLSPMQLARVLRSVTPERLESLTSTEARQELRQRLHLAALACAQREQSSSGRSAFVEAWIDNARAMSLENRQEACLDIALTYSPKDLRNLDNKNFPDNRNFKLLSDSLRALHRLRLNEQQTADLAMKFIKEADQRPSLPDSVMSDLLQKLVAYRPYDRRPDTTKTWPIERLNKDDLAWLGECLSKRLADKDTIAALPPTETYANDIARKLDDKALEPRYLEQLLGKYRDSRTRALAFQLLSERATYLSADGWHQQLRNAADEMRNAGFVTIEKLPGQETRLTERITAVCLANDTAGRAAAYEFRKQTGMKVEVLELDSKGILPTERKLVLFSDPQKLSNSNPLREAIIASPNIYKSETILQFDRGLNYLDLASRRTNPSHIEAKFDQMVAAEQIPENKLVREVKPQILAMYGSNDEARYLQSAIEQANNQSSDRRVVRSMMYFDQALTRTRGVSDQAPAQLIAHIMASTVEVSNYQHMMEDAARLHSQITAGQDGINSVQVENIIFVRSSGSLSGTEKVYRTDSSDYITHVYRLANGLEGQTFDHQFITLDRALRMKEGEYNGKTFVFLNDAHYSGEQGTKLIEGQPNGTESKLGGLGRLAKLVNGKAEVVFGTLGSYNVGLDFVSGVAEKNGIRVENVRTYQNAYDLARSVIERSLTGTNVDGLSQEFKLTGISGQTANTADQPLIESGNIMNAAEPNQIALQILGRPQIENLGQRVVSALLLPHMRSNLTPKNVDRLADFLNLPRSHNESKPVVLPDTAPTYMAIMEDTLNYYSGGITTPKDLAFVLSEGLTKFIAENPDGVFDNTNILTKPIEIEFSDEPIEQNPPNKIVMRLDHQYSDPANLQAAQEAAFSQLMHLRSQVSSSN